MSDEAEFQTGSARVSPVFVFTGTIFLSAALLFFVQPLYAKIVLPVLGGAPAVWTTAMLFFQSVLIAGYLYAHLMIRFVPAGFQVLIHMAIWALAIGYLPLALPADWSPDPAANAGLQTLAVFAIGVGVPFAVLSANAPLLQAWYTRSGGPSASDPYFLYAASNLGSLIALLAFPLVAEPLFGATDIGRGFAVGFLVLGAGLMASGLLGLGSEKVRTAARDTADPISARQIGHWLVLAFVPSSMMLAVTSKISADVGAIPLIWVVPLALYLLTFVITFRDSRWATSSHLRLVALASLVWLSLVFTGQVNASLSVSMVAGLLVAYFGLALFAHRILYETRPSGSQLTAFYLVMSVGGALGGLFNSIIAPAMFDTLVEGMVTTLVGVAVLLHASRLPVSRRTLLALAYAAGAALLLWMLPRFFGVESDRVLTAAMIALAAMAALVFRAKPVPTALAAALVVVAGDAIRPESHLFRDRSFFGVHRVTDSDTTRHYVNGTTLHGMQYLADLDAARPQPLAYYHENGPLAAAFVNGPGVAAERVGIVGLGVGALACYARPGQDWQFYEIDPVVDQVARDTDLFTFLSSCTPDAPTHLGDARRVLADQRAMGFGVLVIDAYSSDSVPVHLTTVEAITLYMSHLAENGVLVFHVSNRYFDIDLPLAEAARHLGLSAGIIRHAATDAPGDTATVAVFMARDESDFGALAENPEWSELVATGGPLWVDDYANPLAILRWRD